MRLVMILRLHVEDQGPDDTAARIIAGPPISIFSMQSSWDAPFATVSSKG